MPFFHARGRETARKDPASAHLAIVVGGVPTRADTGKYVPWMAPDIGSFRFDL